MKFLLLVKNEVLFVFEKKNQKTSPHQTYVETSAGGL